MAPVDREAPVMALVSSLLDCLKAGFFLVSAWPVVRAQQEISWVCAPWSEATSITELIGAS